MSQNCFIQVSLNIQMKYQWMNNLKFLFVTVSRLFHLLYLLLRYLPEPLLSNSVGVKDLNKMDNDDIHKSFCFMIMVLEIGWNGKLYPTIYLMSSYTWLCNREKTWSCIELSDAANWLEKNAYTTGWKLWFIGKCAKLYKQSRTLPWKL